MADKVPIPERLAEPTPADIAQRLADDAAALTARLDAWCGPVEDDLDHRLEQLAKAIEALRG